MKIIFLADIFLEDIIGGGEICNECIFLFFKKKYNIEKIRCHTYSLEQAKKNKDVIYIIGNFSLLSKDVVDYITNNSKYIIYEHDYKFHALRNPAKFINFIIPKNQLIYNDFYKNAIKIICQSKFQKEIFFNNLGFNNIISIGTNFWLNEHYNIMEQMSKKNKNDLCAIIDYNISHKNTIGAIKYCSDNKLNYELIVDENYINFLKKLGSYKKFIFLPQTPETFSRTTIEAKMMNVEPLTNNLVGCKKEDWYYNFKGIELIQLMKEKNISAYNLFEELICNQ